MFSTIRTVYSDFSRTSIFQAIQALIFFFWHFCMLDLIEFCNVLNGKIVLLNKSQICKFKVLNS